MTTEIAGSLLAYILHDLTKRAFEALEAFSILAASQRTHKLTTWVHSSQVAACRAARSALLKPRQIPKREETSDTSGA